MLTIKRKLLLSIGIPFFLSFVIGLSVVLFISYTNISNEIEASILRQNNTMIDSMSNLVSSTAKSYMQAISDMTQIDSTILENLSNENFLMNGYIYLVDRNGIITQHPDKTLIGTESVNIDWLLSRDLYRKEFYNYEFENRDKLLYKYFNEDLDMFVLTSVYIDDFSSYINIHDLRAAMGKIKIGSSGYPFIITEDGLCLTHPEEKYLDTYMNNLQDADGNFFIQRVINEKNGFFKYNWDTGDGVKVKTLYFSYDKNSKLIICSTGFIEDYYTSFKNTLDIIILTTILILLISALILFRVSESFLKPIERLTEMSIEITKGKLDQVFIKSNTMEINTLGTNFIHMQDSIKNNLKTLENAINTKTQELQEAQAHLIQSEKMSSLGSLVAGVAHEINTPVGIGVTAASHLEHESAHFLNMYENGNLTKSAFEEFIKNTNIESKILLANMNKAASLIQSFKKVAVDQSIELIRKFNVKEYIEDLLISLKHKLKSKDISIKINCDEDLVMNSYPGPLSQILTNLIINSFIHGFDDYNKGEINISVIQKNRDIVDIVYTDNGVGIPEDVILKVFDPFFTTKRNNGGTGLGLHLVFNIVNSTLNGTITCHNIKPHGVEFHMRLPIMA